MNADVLSPVHGLAPGTRLAEFEVQAVLGAGGFGMVYSAYDHSLDRQVAIKEYLPSGLAWREGQALVLRPGADAQLFEAGRRSFLDEARLLAQFDHPSLVKVFRVWEQNGTAYLVMPLYQGLTLKEACTQMRTPPPERWLRRLLWSVLQALEPLHRRGTLHRDIAPDNILLQDVGPPVLLDLGAARRVLGAQDRHTAIVKVNYAPIEQYADAPGLRQGPWTDIYALAAVAYGCLSQAPPMPATARVVRDALPSPASLAEGLRARYGIQLSQPLVDGLAAGLALEPDRRPQDLAAFRRLLRLEPMPDMDRFDWRAELGEVWQPSRRPFRQARDDAPTQVIASAPRPAPPAVEPMAAQPRSAVRVVAPTDEPPDLPSDSTPGPPRRWGVKLALAGLVMGLLVAMGMVASPSEPLPSAGAVPVQAPPAPVAVRRVADGLGSGARPVESTASVPAMSPALGAGGAASSGAPSGAGHARPARASLSGGAPAPAAPAPAAPAVPEPAPAPAVVAAPEPSRPPPQPRELSAEQICPDSNFFTRPMCLFRTCQKPPYAAMRVCVDNARHLRESQRSNDP